MGDRVFLSNCLSKVLEVHGQDLFLKPGCVPRVRSGGQVLSLPFDEIREADTENLSKLLLNPVQQKVLHERGSVDFGFSVDGNGGPRFRGNIFRQQGSYSFVVRTLWRNIPSFEELNIPLVLKKIALERSGIILVAGAVSAGKTTTITAMIDMMNQNVKRHLITIEDPIEYLHKDKHCVINQREIGIDAPDFETALHYVVRQSPDVVVLGEMRSAETFHFAVAAAEVGRLVIATVHARSVVQIFDRIMGFFPLSERDAVLSMLYPNITCFCVQKLLPKKEQKGMVPAFEIMTGNYTTRQLVKEKKFDKVLQAMRNGKEEGMQTMDDSLFDLWKNNQIDSETALAASERPQELENTMKGIRIDGQGGKILGA